MACFILAFGLTSLGPLIHRPMLNIECGIIQKCLVMIFNSYTSRKCQRNSYKHLFEEQLVIVVNKSIGVN